MKTPHLGVQQDDESATKKEDEQDHQSFLQKQNQTSAGIASNHLYKFNAAILQKAKNEDVNNVFRQQLESVEGVPKDRKNCDSQLSTKRIIQRTPLSSNLKNYIESFRFETPINYNGGKLLKFATPSSGGESTTTATSMRQISNVVSPDYGLLSPADSQCDVISNDAGVHLRYTPHSTKKDLMKQSLERIDKAIKRYGKKIMPGEMPEAFSISQGLTNDQMREYLQSEQSSIAGSVQVGRDPWGNRDVYYRNKAFSENVADSIMCESDAHDLDNFTLGPAQFGNLRPFVNSKSSSSKNLINEFRKEEKRHALPKAKRRNIDKYHSADRVFSQKNSLAFESIPNGVVVLTNHNSSHNPFVVIENRSRALKRERGSAPTLEVYRNGDDEYQRGLIIDEGYDQVPISIKPSNKRHPFHSTINPKLADSRRHKGSKANREYYSQSPQHFSNYERNQSVPYPNKN